VNLQSFLPYFTSEIGKPAFLSCSTKVRWIYMTKPSYITGTILKAFKEGPPVPTPEPTSFMNVLAGLSPEQRVEKMKTMGLSASELGYLDNGMPMPNGVTADSPSGPSLEAINAMAAENKLKGDQSEGAKNEAKKALSDYMNEMKTHLNSLDAARVSHGIPLDAMIEQHDSSGGLDVKTKQDAPTSGQSDIAQS